MDVKVTHNGTNITSHVVRYSREHKICSGIGMLEMEVDYTYSGNFDTWDKIVIEENGKKSGQYYVSTASQEQPSSVTVITAQDGSKRLSDYFISDPYLIDYPSYASFWLGYFLAEMGIKYMIVSPDPGTLLSNNTSLGLMSGYEQIMYLLQLNGWYITFDYNDTAIIGKLTGSYGSVKGSYTDRDIISISTVKSDGMLRNRVVVWGKGDPKSKRWIFADVYKATKWDYDKKDRRTVVISNSNIRKTSDAFLLANKCLLEFSTITVEKHLELTGARNLMVGDIVTVRNKIFTGKGKITTFGTVMEESGLRTILILDERCPRLFAFWDLGGFVYVGTFGSGVWRKHIMPAWSGSPTGSGLIGFASGIYNASGWFDYSSGLYDDALFVTDLHVNAGLLACVTSSGEAYYSLEDEHPWSGVMFSGFTVSMSGTLITTPETGEPIDSTVYSGVLARACIIDRDTNHLRFVVDTRSGENLGDFLMETDPMTQQWAYAYITPSGVEPISGFPSGYIMRSWLLDVDGYSGSIIESYPIGISGNYNFWGYDVENDGSHDYVEVMGVGSGNFPSSIMNGWHRSSYYTDNTSMTENFPEWALYGKLDFNGTLKNYMSYSGYPVPQCQSFDTVEIANGTHAGLHERTFYLEDYYPGGTSSMAAFGSGSTGKLRLIVTTIVSDINGNITTNHYGKDTSFTYTKIRPVSILKTSLYTYKFIAKKDMSIGPIPESLVFIDYDISSGQITESEVSGYPNSYPIATNTVELVVGTNLHVFYRSDSDIDPHFEVSELVINLNTGSHVKNRVLYIEGDYDHHQYSGDLAVYPTKDGYTLIMPIIRRMPLDPEKTLYEVKFYRAIKKSGYGVQMSLTYDHFATFGAVGAGETHSVTISAPNPFNEEVGVFSYTYRSSPLDWDRSVSVLDDGYTFLAQITSDPWPTNMLRQSTNRFKYSLAEDSDVFYLAEGNFISPTYTELEYPEGYTLIEYLGTDSINSDMFFSAYSGAEISSNIKIITFSDTNSNLTRIADVPKAGETLLAVRGNFRITNQSIYWEKPNPIPMYYPVYFVLQRDNYDFAVVKSGLFRDRLDISNYAPLVTMDRRISSTNLFYIGTDNVVTSVTNPSMSGVGTTASGQVFSLGYVSEDFRYAGSEENPESGYMSELYVALSGGISAINMADLASLSGYFSTSSGYVTRIETSNYSFPFQYMFASLSGYTGASGSYHFVFEDTSEVTIDTDFAPGETAFGFVQREPVSGTWVDYSSGYPQARTTIIRLDDML